MATAGPRLGGHKQTAPLPDANGPRSYLSYAASAALDPLRGYHDRMIRAYLPTTSRVAALLGLEMTTRHLSRFAGKIFLAL